MKKLWLWALVGTLLAFALKGNLSGYSRTPVKIGEGYRAKPCGQEQAGFWILPVPNRDGLTQVQVEPYYPQAGDILLYDYQDKAMALLFKLIGSGAPMHAAIVIQRPDGTPAVLECGPNSRPQAFTCVQIVDVRPRLESYQGHIIVRRLRQPLSAEESAHLTHFAYAQVGKKFAVGRLALQATPFRPRHGLRRLLFAHTYLDRQRWICSENVVAAATVAGRLDPEVHFANAMYPRDLAYDENYDLSHVYYAPVSWIRQPGRKQGHPKS